MHELTVERVTATLLGSGARRVPTDDFWALYTVWRQTLLNAGVLCEKTARGWVIDIHLLTPESLLKACGKRTFKTETGKAVKEALATLRTVFADHPANLELLGRLEA